MKKLIILLAVLSMLVVSVCADVLWEPYENEYYMENCQRIISAREYTIKMLREQGFEVLDSLGNFVFAKPTGMGAAALKAQLAERGILVRHWDKPRVKDYLRITIGTMQQMQALDAAIEMIFGRA